MLKLQLSGLNRRFFGISNYALSSGIERFFVGKPAVKNNVNCAHVFGVPVKVGCILCFFSSESRLTAKSSCDGNLPRRLF